MLAGMNTAIDFQNPEIMQDINDVLTSFDYNADTPIDEDELIFSAKMMAQEHRFQSRKRHKQSHRRRNAIEKKVDPNVEQRLRETELEFLAE